MNISHLFDNVFIAQSPPSSCLAQPFSGVILTSISIRHYCMNSCFKIFSLNRPNSANSYFCVEFRNFILFPIQFLENNSSSFYDRCPSRSVIGTLNCISNTEQLTLFVSRAQNAKYCLWHDLLQSLPQQDTTVRTVWDMTLTMFCCRFLKR